jgi:hypothetical protein
MRVELIATTNKGSNSSKKVDVKSNDVKRRRPFVASSPLLCLVLEMHLTLPTRQLPSKETKMTLNNDEILVSRTNRLT